MVAEIQSRIFTVGAGQTVSSISIPWYRDIAYGSNEEGSALMRSGRLPFGDFTVCHEFIEEGNAFREISCGEKRSQPILQLSLIYPMHKFCTTHFHLTDFDEYSVKRDVNLASAV